MTKKTELLANLADMKAQLKRARSAQMAPDPTAAALNVLHTKRSEILGTAFVEGGEADTKAIDKEIATATTKAQAARGAREAAEAAEKLLLGRIAEAEAELALIDDQLLKEAKAAAQQRMDELLTTYQSAAEDLVSIIADLGTCSRELELLRAAMSPTAAGGANWADVILTNGRLEMRNKAGEWVTRALVDLVSPRLTEKVQQRLEDLREAGVPFDRQPPKRIAAPEASKAIAPAVQTAWQPGLVTIRQVDSNDPDANRVGLVHSVIN